LHTHNELVPSKTQIDELSPQFSISFTIKNEKLNFIYIANIQLKCYNVIEKE